MIKIRFKRCGRKKRPFYRIVLANSLAKRDGKVIEELGFYDPLEKILQCDSEKITLRISNGAQPTRVVKNLLKRFKLDSNKL